MTHSAVLTYILFIQCTRCHDLLVAELIYGSGHLIVQLLIKPALLGFVPAPQSPEVIRKKQTHSDTLTHWNRCWETRSCHAGYSDPVWWFNLLVDLDRGNVVNAIVSVSEKRETFSPVRELFTGRTLNTCVG